MEQKFTAQTRDEDYGHWGRALDAEVVSRSVPNEDALDNRREAQALYCEESASGANLSCEEAFAEIQGKVIFLDDPDAPTIDEWPQVR